MSYETNHRVWSMLALVLALMFTGGVGVAMADHHEKDGKQKEEQKEEQQAEQEGDDGYNPSDEGMGGAVDKAGGLFEGDGSDVDGM